MGQSTSRKPVVDEYLKFLDVGVTPFHAAASVRQSLAADGFDVLRLDERWTVKPGGKYVVSLGDGALLAVRLGDPLAENGATVLVAHTDSPALRVKERAVSWRKGYLAVPTELYGTPIVSTWLDRDLGIAGRAITPDGEGILVDLPIRVVVPNLAIHLNRKVNEGYHYNPQDHLVALAGVRATVENPEKGGELTAILADAIGTSVDDVWEHELYLYDPQPAALAGTEEELIVAGRIDNLAGSFACLQAFLAAETSRPVMLVLYNHEEIGSLTGEGAQSAALSRTIERLVLAEGGNAEDAAVAAARSILVSNDVAHALHPSFSDKHDPDYAPLLNGGPVLKLSSSMKYATTAATGARFRGACKAAGVPMQRLVNRSDMRAGGTVGPISWARTGIPTVDVGVGILAMHSIRETAGTHDMGMMIKALKAVAEQ